MVRKDLRGGDGVGAAQGETGGQSSLQRIGLQKRGGELGARLRRAAAARTQPASRVGAVRTPRGAIFQTLAKAELKIWNGAGRPLRTCRWFGHLSDTKYTNPRRSIGNRDCTHQLAAALAVCT